MLCYAIAFWMNKWLLMLVMVLGIGCASTPRGVLPRPSVAHPTNALVTQRGVLTARGKQFTLNGYLSLSEQGGMRLIVTENFGNLLADVLVQTNGAVHVMRSSAAFRPVWIERYMAADLKCLFGKEPSSACRVAVLSPTHFIIKRFWYSLDLHIVDIKPGPQPAATFEVPPKKTP